MASQSDNRRPRVAGRGLTLVETTLSVVIMATVVVIALGMFSGLVKSRKTTNSRMQATGLAGQLLTEIIQNGYSDPNSPTHFGPEPGETTRAAFNDVDDYHNWSESPPTAKDATVIAGLTGWTRQVVVQYLDPDTMAVSATDKELKQVTVTVTDPRKVATTVVALRSSSGAYDQKPAQVTTAVRWVGVELQIGSDSGNRMVSGASVPNIVSAGP